MSSTYFEPKSFMCFACISMSDLVLHVKHNIPYLYWQTSYWKWTLGFKTCRRHQKL